MVDDDAPDLAHDPAAADAETIVVDPEGTGEPTGELHPYAVLPEPIRPEDMVTSQDVTFAQDPEFGRNTETEFMLKYI